MMRTARRSAETWITRPRVLVRMLAISVSAAVFGSLGMTGLALAALPDGRAYELVTPVEKNGVSPYGVVASASGEAVDFQAPGGFAGAVSGSLNLYQSRRTGTGWQTVPLTPTPTTTLGALEEQVPVFYSPDLTQTIFTTPQSYDAGDADGGALDLYLRSSGGELSWLSQGTQGGTAPKEVTFDGATPDVNSVVFSTGESLLQGATGLEQSLAFPEAEYLYDRVMASGQTNLVNVDNSGEQIGGGVKTTLAETPAVTTTIIGLGQFSVEGVEGTVEVASTAGFIQFRHVTVGTGASAETADVNEILSAPPRLRLIGRGPRGGWLREPMVGETVTQASGVSAGDRDITVASTAGFVAGDHITLGTGTSAESTEISHVANATELELSGLVSASHAVGEPVSKPADGAVLGNGVDLAMGTPPASEYVPADAAGTTANAISRDGSKIFFESPAPSAGREPATLYMREDNSRTVEIANSTSVRYEGAAADGSLVFYTSEGGLYEFNTTSGQIGSAAAMSNATIAAGVLGVTVIANDGSHIYFASDGVLATNSNSQGAAAVEGRPNLYVYDTATSETTFIATVAEKDVVAVEGGGPTGLVGVTDVKRPAVPTPDGGVLAFTSAGNLTGRNPSEEFTEIYRYAAGDGSLSCVSCTPEGVAPTGNADFGETAGGTYDPAGLSSPISENGDRVFFDTPDSLVPEDRNTGASPNPLLGTSSSTDVYEWEGGHVHLISDGGANGPAMLDGATPSGSDVFFVTSATLVPQESDGGYQNVFDARVGGGFPAPGAGAPSCVGSGCRAAFGSPPVLAMPGSTGLSGPGNLPAPPVVKVKPKPKAKTRAVKCRRGSVKRRVKGHSVCVKRHNRGGK
jgi:hypothetical protein